MVDDAVEITGMCLTLHISFVINVLLGIISSWLMTFFSIDANLEKLLVHVCCESEGI